MWFKNSIVYRFNANKLPELNELSTLLQKKALPACPKFQPETIGWLPPFPKSDAPLIHNNHSALLMCYAKEERILPPAVIRETLHEKIQEIQTSQARDVYRKEKSRLREDIVATLLPKAFTQKKLTPIFFDLQRGWLFINTSSSKKADEVIACLHDTIGSLDIEPVTTKNSIKLLMSQWIKAQTKASPFIITEECKLQHTKDTKASINVRYHDTISEAALSQLNHGYLVTALQLNWKETIQFILQDNLVLKRITALDVIQEQIKNTDAPDAQTLFDNQFTLMTLSLSQLISDLIMLIDGTKNTTNQLVMQEAV